MGEIIRNCIYKISFEEGGLRHTYESTNLFFFYKKKKERTILQPLNLWIATESLASLKKKKKETPGFAFHIKRLAPTTPQTRN